MNITKWKKPIWKGYILYDSNYFNYMTFQERENYGDSKKLSSGLGEEAGMNSWSIEDFTPVKLCMIL